MNAGWRGIQAIHGDKGQHDRSSSLESFKSGRSPILIATDVAARGLDIPDVYCVINYSFPLTIEDYVHRIGRTGRAGKQGIAHTLFTGTFINNPSPLWGPFYRKSVPNDENKETDNHIDEHLSQKSFSLV